MKRAPISTRRMTFVLLIVLAFTLLACNLITSLSQGNEPTASSTSTAGVENLPTQPAIPDGWKLSQDASGACQVATPPDWQLGVDFFLAAEKTGPGPFEDSSEQFPPSGPALWGGDADAQLPEGKWFQMRTALVTDDGVCSVWRIRENTDFTDDEKSQLEQVGSTLQEVH